MRRTLVVVAEAPIPGKVKANFCPPLDLQTAAELQECLLLDTLEKASAVPDTELVISYSPEGALSYFREAAPGAAGYILQEGSFGDCMRQCFRRLSEPGRAVVVMGTDNPTLPAQCLELAFQVMATCMVDAVLGPANDGSCYLVGLASPSFEFLNDVDWNGPNAHERSIERAAELGLGWFLLPQWQSVTNPADLVSFNSTAQKGLARNSRARHTTRFLGALADRGIV